MRSDLPKISLSSRTRECHALLAPDVGGKISIAGRWLVPIAAEATPSHHFLTTTFGWPLPVPQRHGAAWALLCLKPLGRLPPRPRLLPHRTRNVGLSGRMLEDCYASPQLKSCEAAFTAVEDGCAQAPSAAGCRFFHVIRLVSAMNS